MTDLNAPPHALHIANVPGMVRNAGAREIAEAYGIKTTRHVANNSARTDRVYVVMNTDWGFVMARELFNMIVDPTFKSPCFERSCPSCPPSAALQAPVRVSERVSYQVPVSPRPWAPAL